MAHLHHAELSWQRQPHEVFTDQRYSRRHRLRFDGGAEWVGSSSPQVVPLPMSDAAAVDPEELFVAALSACHMLWFLSLAAAAGWVVDRYDDAAEGEMARAADGGLWLARVTLRPAVAWGGRRQPDAAAAAALHHAAHEACFIARSVRSDVQVQPR